MEIRELDPRTASDEDLLTIHRIEEACSHERPFRSPELSLANLPVLVRTAIGAGGSRATTARRR